MTYLHIRWLGSEHADCSSERMRETFNSVLRSRAESAAMSNSPILQVQDLGYPWPTFDPFLLCAYLDDA